MATHTLIKNVHQAAVALGKYGAKKEGKHVHPKIGAKTASVAGSKLSKRSHKGK